VALEENKDIFDTIVKSKKKSTQATVATPPPLIVAISEDLADMPLLPQKFAQKGKFSK